MVIEGDNSSENTNHSSHYRSDGGCNFLENGGFCDAQDYYSDKPAGPHECEPADYQVFLKEVGYPAHGYRFPTPE
jgi:hypothetical protein